MLLYTKHNGTIEHAFDARQGVACRLHTRNTLCPRHTRVLQMLWGPTVDKRNNGGHTLLVPARCKSQHDAHQSSSERVFINTTIRYAYGFGRDKSPPRNEGRCATWAGTRYVTLFCFSETYAPSATLICISKYNAKNGIVLRCLLWERLIQIIREGVGS